MQITVKGKNVEITEALKEYAEEKVGKMSKYLDSIISADVTLSTERNWHIVDVKVHAGGVVLRGEERTNDMYSSIDQVLEKMERQVKRQKEKTFGTKYESIRTSPDALDKVIGHGEKIRGREDLLDEYSREPRVIRVKMTAVKPMTVEAAIKEMEAMGNSFLLFYRGDTNQLNVIYKRKNDYGLIEPDRED